MTVAELYRKLDEMIPASLSCAWDNDGLMCCPDADREIRRVLVALDVTSYTVREAIDGGYDAVVSHHPFIFSPLRSLNENDFIPRKAMELIRHGISVMSFHTRLDALPGGVNDVLAGLLGLKDVSAFGEEGIGRVGMTDSKMTCADFAAEVKKILGAPAVLYSDAGLPVHRVAVLGGEGGDDIGAAMAAGADTYVSGRLGYHHMTDAPDMGINLIEAGHFYTEDPVCAFLCRMIESLGISCTKLTSNKIACV
ncbi:MAG: Nif3-like dinuclear metal center hexameric protein [Eubacteriales bacterium]